MCCRSHIRLLGRRGAMYRLPYIAKSYRKQLLVTIRPKSRMRSVDFAEKGEHCYWKGLFDLNDQAVSRRRRPFLTRVHTLCNYRTFACCCYTVSYLSWPYNCAQGASLSFFRSLTLLLIASSVVQASFQRPPIFRQEIWRRPWHLRPDWRGRCIFSLGNQDKPAAV